MILNLKMKASTSFSLAACHLAWMNQQAHAAKCGDFFYNKCSTKSEDPRYDPSVSNDLKAQNKIYEKLEGFWVGTYKFYDGDGNVMPSSLYDKTYGFGWPYDYGSYRGGKHQ